jgi:sulfatase modifying factor 1
MPSVFISYRHESSEHQRRVRELAARLEEAGLSVIADFFAQERIFCGGGPDEGWTRWSKAQAANPDHKVLIIASEGWFACYEQKLKPGATGLGASAEARVIEARIAKSFGIASDIRIVELSGANSVEVPLDLWHFHRFAHPDDVADMVRWLKAEREFPVTLTQAPLEGPPTPPSSTLVRTPPLNRKNLEFPIAFDWIDVPAGDFWLGFSEDQIRRILDDAADDPDIQLRALEEAIRFERRSKIYLHGFSISRTLVTNDQFCQFMNATGYQTTQERRGENEPWSVYATPAKSAHPVVEVSFENAEAFCRWAKVRLPHVNEWKKAYRGPNGNVYPWGDRFDSMKCNTYTNQTFPTTSPVDAFAAFASPYGCTDMIGNVEEWIGTSGNEMPYPADWGPAGIERLAQTKIAMGGGWSMDCRHYGLPVLNRFAMPELSSEYLGFRVVC